MAKDRKNPIKSFIFNSEHHDKAKVDQTKEQTSPEDTIFIRNLSFDTEEDTLKQFICDNFGETIYCVICKDKETDESKGTAFAKFKDSDSAKKCLEEFKDRELQTKFHLDGRNLIVLPALSREKIQENKNVLEKKGKDKRNLVLAKEGFIHHESDEAKELSKSDVEKRRALNTRKRDLLKNLHNFVSDTRLCIHNLPASIDDQKLRKIFLENTKLDQSNPKIVECRVMRNKKGSGQLGTSKGFGFVAFSKHEHALAALRNINNNPMIFSKEKRPIVEFSIENLVALNKKKTRLVNSQRKNQTRSEEGVSRLSRVNSSKSAQEKSSVKKKKFGRDSKKLDPKKMKRRGTVHFEKIDTNEEDNVLKKIKKAVNAKLKSKGQAN